MKILIVDDNSDDLSLLGHIVERNGHLPLKANNGKEGLALAASYLPDLIISDALMPVMDGFVFLKKLKEDEALRSIPFIFYSAAYQAAQDVALAKSLGAIAYIFKPTEPKELWQRVEQTLEQCQQQPPVQLRQVKEDQLHYLEKYSEIISAKLEEKVYELEKTLRLQKVAEQKSKEQSEFLQRSLDALTHPFYVINVHDYTIALANIAAKSNKLQAGTTCYELTHDMSEPCSGDKHPCTIASIKKSNRPVIFEHIHLGVAGEKRHVEVHGYPVFGDDGEVVQVIEYCIDITERKKGVEELRRLSTVMEHAADSIVITDKEAIIQYVNPSFERITGYSAAEVIGKNPRILQSGRHSEQFYREMWDTLKRGEVWRGSLIIKKKDGSLFEEEGSISPVLDDRGRVMNYVALKQDVTEQKKLEEHLQQSQKMEAIGTLAGGIAHDFNNILTAILGYSELIVMQLQEGSALRKHQEQVIKSGNRAKELVRQILTFSRQTKQERMPINCHLVVKDALRLLRSSIPTTIEIREEIDSTAGKVLADPTQLHQIVMNLGTNAYHAMRQTGGVLSIKLDVCKIEKNDHLVRTFDVIPGTYLRIEVSDTGYGMDKQTQEKIFEPYYTTKEKGEGTGLGLAIVHGIVKSYDGHISVDSELGKGTSFQVYLPRVHADHCDASKNVGPEIPHGSERILLVDDEKVIVEMYKETLESLGYQVFDFTNSVELLQAFQGGPGDYDLVITDMTMPDLTGAELSQRLLAIRPDMPIILCTGFSELINQEKAATLGIKGYLMKPVVILDLATTIRRVLDK